MGSILHYTHIGAVKWTSNRSGGPAFRKKGPCYISVNGEVRFSQLLKDNQSRLHGPSAICADGTVAYCNKPSIFHRTNGPAIINADGSKEYWVDNERMSDDEFFLKYGVL